MSALLKRLSHIIANRIPVSVSTAIAIISALAAIASAFFSCNQNQMLRKQLHLHIRPEVGIGLSIYKNKERGYFQPVLSIRNRSPVAVLSLSADYQFIQFDKATKKFRDNQPTSSLTSEQSVQAHVLFQKKIDPNDVVAAELGNVISLSPTPRSIFVFVVFSTYYREGDMERFENRSIYFFDNGKVFDLAGFMPHPDFDQLFPFINTVRPPDWGFVIRDLPAEMVLHKPRADQNDAERTTNDTKNQDDTRQLLPAPSDIRIIFTDE